MFFDHGQKVIWEEYEIKLLQSLLRDYSLIISQFGFAVRSSLFFVKNFQGRTGFHSCLEYNHSELGYGISGASTYVKAALSANGIGTEQLIHNVVEWLQGKYQAYHMATKSKTVGNLPPFVLMLLSPLWAFHAVYYDATSINTSITLYDSQQKLIDSFYNLGMGSCYQDILMLQDA